MDSQLMPTHGSYRKLKSFQVAQLAYDLTVRFCKRYVDRRSRTHDQMVQAARSGVQNIAEGSLASGSSKKTEIKLTNVARASLEELRLDFEDFLRHRGLPRWDRNDPRRQNLVERRPRSVEEVREWAREVRGQSGPSGPCGPSGPSGESEQRGFSQFPASTGSTRSTGSTGSTKSTYPEIAANAILTLIAVAVALLERQLAAQSAAFEREGGFTERLYRRRTQKRRKSR